MSAVKFNKSILVQDPDDPIIKTTLRGHKEIVTGVSFNPNMKQLASCSQDSVVMVWNLADVNKSYNFVGHNGAVNDVTFSPDGSTIASASKDETIHLWQNNYNGAYKILKGHSGSVRSVNYSTNGKLLLSSGDDKQIKIWNPYERKCLATFKGHIHWVKTCHFSPDARYVVSGSDDKTVKIWDVETKADIQTFLDHTGVVNSVKFHPEGVLVGSGSHDKKIKIWDLRSKKLAQHYDAHADGINQICFHPSGNYLASASEDAKIKIWDVRKGLLSYTLYAHEGDCSTIAFSSKGDFFATGGADNLVMVWRSNFEDSGQETLAETRQRFSLSASKITAKSQKSATKFYNLPGTPNKIIKKIDVQPQQLNFSPPKAKTDSKISTGLRYPNLSPLRMTKKDPEVVKELTFSPKDQVATIFAEQNETIQTSQTVNTVQNAEFSAEITFKQSELKDVSPIKVVEGLPSDRNPNESNIFAANLSQPKVDAKSQLESQLGSALERIVQQLSVINNSIASIDSRLQRSENQVKWLSSMVKPQPLNNQNNNDEIIPGSFISSKKN